MIARGNVQSVSQPVEEGRARHGRGARAGPAEGRPARQRHRAAPWTTTARSTRPIYTGGARLWQKDTAIAADTITIDEKTGDLYASGQVRSTLPLEQMDSKTNAAHEGHVHRDRQGPALRGRAAPRDLHHRRARQRPARRSARGEDRDVPRGGRRLAREGRGVRRRSRSKTDVRTAKGQRMTYFAADERYLMTGSPVSIIEECRETTGKTLTFYRSVDRVLVDGIEETSDANARRWRVRAGRPQVNGDAQHARTHQVVRRPHGRPRRQSRGRVR